MAHAHTPHQTLKNSHQTQRTVYRARLDGKIKTHHGNHSAKKSVFQHRNAYSHSPTHHALLFLSPLPHAHCAPATLKLQSNLTRSILSDPASSCREQPPWEEQPSSERQSVPLIGQIAWNLTNYDGNKPCATYWSNRVPLYALWREFVPLNGQNSPELALLPLHILQVKLGRLRRVVILLFQRDRVPPARALVRIAKNEPAPYKKRVSDPT